MRLFLLLFLGVFFQSILSEVIQEQYQQFVHLKGDFEVSNDAVYGETGIYNQSNSIGGVAYSVSKAINNEIWVFYGTRLSYSNCLDEIWTYNVDLNQWKFVRGRKNSNPKYFEYSEINVFEKDNEIRPRKYTNGWLNENDGEKGIIYFFGGMIYQYNFVSLNTYNIRTNEFWMYDIAKNEYAIIRTHPIEISSSQMTDFMNEVIGSCNEIGKFDQSNVPGGRRNHVFVKIDDENVLLLGGNGYTIRDKTVSGADFVWDSTHIYSLDDSWIFSTRLMQWKGLGGSIFNTITHVWGETNVYDKANTMFGRWAFGGTKINEEEVLIFGGMSYLLAGYTTTENLVQKYNISSNQWKYVTGAKTNTEKDSPIFGREYESTNVMRGRSYFGMFRINEKEILVFGGWSNAAWGTNENDRGSLNDEWIFNFEINQWKYTGKEISKYTDFREREYMIGGVYGYIGAYYDKENPILILIGGIGYDMAGNSGYLNDCWEVYYGNMCNSIKDTDPTVCSNSGTCVGFNKCNCKTNHFGDDCDLGLCNGILSNSSDVCSRNGICLQDKCACFDITRYTNDDCGTDELLKLLTENIWIFISLPIILIISIFVVILFIVIVIFLISKLKKTMKKFDGIEDIDLILEEAKLEQNNKNPKIKINKSLFKIEYKDLKLISILGEGGSMSIVYMVQWGGNYCAYKGFKTQLLSSNNEDLFLEFEKEVEIYSSIHHPSILQFYGACVNPPNIGIVLEYCKLGDLTSFFGKYRIENKKNYEINEKIRILKEIASGMNYLHKINVLHRDLKPENVLIDDKENSKIMDFGLSKLTKNADRTMTKMIGTSYYMAPEVYKGNKYSIKCDVYSFAILTFVIITENYFPYGVGITQNKLLKKVTNSSFRPKIEKEDFKNCKFLIPFIQKNWDSDPNNRDSFSKIESMLKKHKIIKKNQKSMNKMTDVELKNLYETQEKEIKRLKKQINSTNIVKNTIRNEKIPPKVTKKRIVKRIPKIPKKRTIKRIPKISNLKKSAPPPIPKKGTSKNRKYYY